ncbi:MAG: alpha/beta fold hydrolase, partial [Dehalococcoidia bacterium]
MADITVKGSNVNYQMAEGRRKGHTVLMIHGATGNSEGWSNQVQFLEEEHTPVTVNLPGRGGSDGPPIDNDVDFREFIRAFSDALDLAPFVICGYSMGGSIALDFAFHYPDRLKGFIMVASSPSWEFSDEMLKLYRENPQKAMERSMEEFGDMFSKHTSEHIKEQVLNQEEPAPVSTGAADLLACATFHLDGDLGKIKVPALVTCGDEDES